ncbi:MAG: PrsW family glutamic-type intramembrane protease [Candidatus Bathyarchaeia archaeon]
MTSDRATLRLHRPDVNELLFFLLSGAIMSVPLTLFVDQLASLLITGLSAFYAALVSVAFLAPVIEEFSKVYPLFYRHGETQRSIMRLAVCVGLGFGIVEFFLYVFGLGANPLERLVGLLFHPASTTISAYGIAVKKPLPYYLVAAGLHFANNFLAVVAPYATLSSLVVVLATVLISQQLYRTTKERFIDEPGICTPVPTDSR